MSSLAMSKPCAAREGQLALALHGIDVGRELKKSLTPQEHARSVINSVASALREADESRAIKFREFSSLSKRIGRISIEIEQYNLLSKEDVNSAIRDAKVTVDWDGPKAILRTKDPASIQRLSEELSKITTIRWMETRRQRFEAAFPGQPFIC